MKRTCFLLLFVAACGANAPSPADQSAVAAWASSDTACITTANTKSQADACRDELRELFCRPDGGILTDAGACTNVTLSNGVRP